MPVIDGTRACATCKGGKGAILTTIFLDGTYDNNFCPVDVINEYITNFMFTHGSEGLKPPRKIFLMKALKPKQKVAIDAPTRINSKLVRCSITFVFSESWLSSLLPCSYFFNSSILCRNIFISSSLASSGVHPQSSINLFI